MKLLLLLLAPLASVTLASAQSYTETFDGGTNAGAWTWGNGGDTIDPLNGNPTFHFKNNNLDTFAPQLSTTALPSPFSGDWRARDVTAFDADLRTTFTNFPFQREATLILTGGGGCSVYSLGTDFVPQIAEGWKSIHHPIDAASPSLPAGWVVLNGCGSDDATWNAVITDVTEVRIFYGDPTFFFILDQWHVGMDNATITEGSLGNYCVATINSTGQAAAMGASGTTSLSADDLIVTAFPMPANQFGVFFYGSGQLQVPFGNGNLCVDGGSAGIQRLDVEFSGTAGMLTHALDYSSPPTLAGQINAGSSWNFQAWFRDPTAGGSAFNLSDGLSLTFTP